MEKSQYYENIMQNLPVGMSMVDRAGNVVEFNRKAEEITGYSREEVLGASHLEFLHGTSDSSVCPLFSRTLKRQKGIVAVETALKRKDGERITTLVTAFPFYESDGSFAGGVELFRDISDQKRKERERKNMLSMFAHDMKNPVSTAKGYLSRMLRGKTGRLTEAQEDYLKIIGEQLDRIGALVMDFLDFSRYESKALKPSKGRMDLAEPVSRNVEALRVEAEEHDVSIAVECPDKLPVDADGTMIDRVVSNLLGNAVKYAPRGREVRVRCGREGAKAVVSVTNPPAIPEEDLPHLFEPFHRIRRDSTGVGLGLAIAREIVKLHGGSIRAFNSSEDEVTFSFSLPLAQMSREGQRS
ncbi:MAG: PAS domain-containing sensor histidine kinase [Nitrospirota bacterium]|jgi:PAS domain S-box-containing protein